MCSRLESNQHLLDFSQAPSPDRLQERFAGRIGVRPAASSAMKLSKTAQTSSGTRNRTSIGRVKACRPSIDRSPSIGFSASGMELPRTSRGERCSVLDRPPEMKKAAEVSLGGLTSNDKIRSRLTAPPCLWLETLGAVHLGIRAFLSPGQTIAFQHAPDAGRNCDRLREAEYGVSSQHDFAKVNSAHSFVKRIFPPSF
jgi:hypothetical protein